MLTDPESTSEDWVSDVWAQAVSMGNIHPEPNAQRCTGRLETILEKLCQLRRSAVRSLILTTAKLQQQRELTVKQQVSTFETRGVSVMF